MNKELFKKDIIKLLAKNRSIRIATILLGSFLVALVVLFVLSNSYARKIDNNQKQIADAQQQLISLQKIVSNPEAANPDADLIEGRGFAPYSEIVPFISLLESLFAIIDPESSITIKDEEAQIFVNRYADYQVMLKVSDKKDLFIKALDELHNSKYLTQVMDLSLKYKASADTEKSELNEADFIIRLYFE